MIDTAVVAAVAVVAGALVAISSRDVRLIALGLLVAIVGTPLVASPWPDPLPLSAWAVGAALVTYLLWAAMRAAGLQSPGSALGPVAETAAAATAFIVGLRVVPVDPLGGSVAAQAACAALFVLALVPLMGRDLVRVGLGIVLMTLSLVLLTNAWVGSMSPLTNYGWAVLLVGIGGATSALIGRTAGVGGGPDAESEAPIAAGTRASTADVVAMPAAPTTLAAPAAARKRTRVTRPKP